MMGPGLRRDDERKSLCRPLKQKRQRSPRRRFGHIRRITLRGLWPAQ